MSAASARASYRQAVLFGAATIVVLAALAVFSGRGGGGLPALLRDDPPALRFATLPSDAGAFGDGAAVLAVAQQLVCDLDADLTAAGEATCTASGAYDGVATVDELTVLWDDHGHIRAVVWNVSPAGSEARGGAAGVVGEQLAQRARALFDAVLGPASAWGADIDVDDEAWRDEVRAAVAGVARSGGPLGSFGSDRTTVFVQVDDDGKFTLQLIG